MAIFKISSTSSSPIHSSLILPSSLSLLQSSHSRRATPESPSSTSSWMACPRPWTPTSYMLATSKGALAAGEARGKRAMRRLLPPELGAGEARSRRAGRRSDRRSLRPASKETLAAGGAWGRGSSRPASREAQRPAKLAASEQGDACGRRSLWPGKLAAGEQGGAATGKARNLRAGRRGGRRSSQPAVGNSVVSACFRFTFRTFRGTVS